MQTPLARRVLRQRRRNKLSKFGNELEERIPRYTSRETPRGLSKDKLFEATRPNRRKPLRAQEYWKEHTFFSLPTLKSPDLSAGLRGYISPYPMCAHHAYLLNRITRTKRTVIAPPTSDEGHQGRWLSVACCRPRRKTLTPLAREPCESRRPRESPPHPRHCDG